MLEVPGFGSGCLEVPVVSAACLNSSCGKGAEGKSSISSEGCILGESRDLMH